MKKRTFCLMLLLALGLLAGCEKKGGEGQVTKIRLENFTYSGCKQSAQDGVGSIRGSSPYGEEYIEYAGDSEGYLHLKHVNAIFNCCPDTIRIEMSLEGNEIRLVEREEKPICNCICEYDLECKVGPLAPQQYTLVLLNGDLEYARVSIDYTPTLIGKFTVEKAWQ